MRSASYELEHLSIAPSITVIFNFSFVLYRYKFIPDLRSCELLFLLRLICRRSSRRLYALVRLISCGIQETLFEQNQLDLFLLQNRPI